MVAEQSFIIVNSTSPLNPNPSMLFVKLAGPRSDEYMVADLAVRDSHGNLIKNPAIVKEYYKDKKRFDGSMITDYNPMAYIFGSGSRQTIVNEPTIQEFLDKTDVGHSYWIAERSAWGDYTFHVLVFNEDGNDWLSGEKCAIGWDLNFVATSGKMKLDGSDLYFGKINDVAKKITPLQQLKVGVEPSHVQCADGLQLAIKSSNSDPICLRPETLTKLEERGWATQNQEISKEQAILLIKNQHPKLQDFPSNGLPPKTIHAEKSGVGWHIMFETQGSGVPIIEAKCFLVDGDGTVVATGEYKNSGNLKQILSIKICS